MKTSLTALCALFSVAFASINYLNEDSAIFRSAETVLKAVDAERDILNHHTRVMNSVDIEDNDKFVTPVNVTLHAVPQGNITFQDGYLKALPDFEPTVWTLTRGCQRKGFLIKGIEPFGRRIYWQSSAYDRLDVGSSDYSRFQIRIVEKENKDNNPAVEDDGGDSPDDDEDQVLYFSDQNDRCLWFNKDGDGRVSSNSACQPIKFKRLEKDPEWEDPINSCP
jgi:hypothetical protein